MWDWSEWIFSARQICMILFVHVFTCRSDAGPYSHFSLECVCVCVCLRFGLVVLNPYVPFNIHYMMERISYTALPCRFLLILQFFMSMWSWLILGCEYISSFFLSASSDATIDEAIMNWANKKVCSYLHFINFQIFHAEEERHWIPHWIHRTILLWQLKNTNSSNPFYIIPPMESYEMELLLMSLYLTAKTSSVCHFPANSVLCAVCAYIYILLLLIMLSFPNENIPLKYTR